MKDTLIRRTASEMLVKCCPKILLTGLAHDSIVRIVESSSVEVGWMHEVTRLGNNFLLNEALPLPCTGGPATVDADHEQLAGYFNELIGEGYDLDKLNRMKCWFHSHVNFRVFASDTDDKQLLDFASYGGEYFIRGIANKSMEVQFDVYFPKYALLVEDVPWDLYTEPTPPEVLDGLERRVKMLLKEPFSFSPVRGEIFDWTFNRKPVTSPKKRQTKRKRKEK